jgi:hypothetical protein
MGFASFERRWLAAVFETILPDGVVEGFPGASRVPLDRFVTDISGVAPWRMVMGVRLALWFVVFLGPLVALGRPRTFLGLAPDDRLRLLRELHASHIYVVRELPVLLKSVACLGYCGLPEIQRRIGIEPTEAAAWTRET